jgi:hypothetical protein
MGTLRYARVLLLGSQYAQWLLDALSASVAYAYNPILYAVAQQTAKEVIAFLLGSLPQVRRKREAETGDDSRCVSRLGIFCNAVFNAFARRP